MKDASAACSVWSAVRYPPESFPRRATLHLRVRYGPSIRVRVSSGEFPMLTTIIIIILILLLIGALPSWGHSRGWGYGPSGLLAIVLIIVLVLMLTGRA